MELPQMGKSMQSKVLSFGYLVPAKGEQAVKLPGRKFSANKPISKAMFSIYRGNRTGKSLELWSFGPQDATLNHRGG